MTNYVGTTVSNYRFESLIGAGSITQVYRGVQTVSGEIAAIKVANDELGTNAGFAARFLRALQSVAALGHPHVAEIFELFLPEPGEAPVVMMEFATGGSLRTLLQQQASGGQPLSLPYGLEIVRQAADGLAYAHNAGVIHGNLKPENLLLAAAPAGSPTGQTTTKVSDFGLAGIVDDDYLGPSAATGSLAYLAPEQCRGTPLDGRSDIYALGIILYEVATGYLPFDIRSPNDAAQKHIEAIPLPPSHVRPDLPAALEAVIMRCLAKLPQERYATAAELEAALRAILESLRSPAPSVAHPSSARAQVMPQILVQDMSGQVRNSVKVTRYGVTVGQDAGNIIVLDGSDIAPQHLHVGWDGQQVSLTDLGAPGGATLSGQRLAPHTATRWNEQEIVRVGSYMLSWQISDPRAPARPPVVSAPPPPPPPPIYTPPTYAYTAPIPRAETPEFVAQSPAHAHASAARRIGVALEETTHVTITPGQPVTVKVRLANLGTTVDHFSVTVEGMPPAWIRLPDQEVQLNPGKDTTVALTITTVRSPEYVAGEYPITIRAHSRERSYESESTETVWTILPYSESVLSIAPSLVTTRWRARYAVNVENRSNASQRYTLAGKDDEQKIRYRFDRPEIDLEPGHTGTVALTVGASRNWIGRAHSRAFVVDATPHIGTAPSGVRAEWVQRALLPAWAPLVPAILFPLVLLLLRWWFTPTITFDSYPLKPVVGDDVKVVWNTEHADRVDIKPVGTNVAHAGSQSLIADNDQTLTLIASGLLRTQKEATITVNAVTPTPKPTLIPGQPVVKLTVEPTILDAVGQSVKITWDAGNAERVEVKSSVDGILSNDRQGTMTVKIVRETTFTVSATNRGIEPASDFKTVVILPKTPVPQQATAAALTVPPPTVAVPTVAMPTAGAAPIPTVPVVVPPVSLPPVVPTVAPTVMPTMVNTGATMAAGTTAASTTAAGTTAAASTSGTATANAAATAALTNATITAIATALTPIDADCRSYDPVLMRVTGMGPNQSVWLLEDQTGLDIATFKTEDDALRAREVARRYTRRCVIGARTPRAITYWTGVAPAAAAQPPLGRALPPEDCTTYNNGATLRVVGNAVMDGEKLIAQLENADDARKTLLVAKQYTSICFVNRKDARSATPAPNPTPTPAAAGTPLPAATPTPANRPPTTTPLAAVITDATFTYWK